MIPLVEKVLLNRNITRSAVKAVLNSSEELVGDAGFDEEEEKQIRIYWRAGNTLVIMLTMLITC